MAGLGALAALAVAGCGSGTEARTVQRPTRAQVDRLRQQQRAAGRREWGWTTAHELEAKRIFARDPAVKPLFAHRRLTIVDSGPWNERTSTKVIGGALIIRLAEPAHGIYRLPEITSYKTNRFKLFRVDVAGASKFEVDVLFKANRVAQVSPLEVTH